MDPEPNADPLAWLKSLARTKCRGCRHHPGNAAPVDLAHPETVDIREITRHVQRSLMCRRDPGSGFEAAEGAGP